MLGLLSAVELRLSQHVSPAPLPPEAVRDVLGHEALLNAMRSATDAYLAATLRSLYAACDEQLDAIAALADAGTTADEPARRPGTSIRLDETMTWTSQHAAQRLTFNLNLNHVHNL